MGLIAVGQLLVPGRTSWPQWVEYNFRWGLHSLNLFYASPSQAEIDEIRRRAAKFSLYLTPDVIYFCFKFGVQPWSDSGFNVWLVPEEDRQSPVPEVGGHALLSVCLTDANTGIVRALRACTLSVDFTVVLEGAILAQLERPFCGVAEIERQSAALYAKYNSRQLAALASTRCKGGE